MKYSRIATLFMRHFRKRRIQLFCSAFPPSSCRTILDVGGTPHIWRLLGDRYQVTLLNPDACELNTEHYECVIGDGRNLEFPDNSFDVAFSNSVIEHVGTWDDMQRMASELQRVGRCFYCQTPNKWFPVEPHLGTLFLHWWPALLQFFFVTRYLTLWGLMNKPDRQQVEKSLADIRLLTRRDLKRLFPGATILTERFFFLAKSYAVIGCRHPVGALSFPPAGRINRLREKSGSQRYGPSMLCCGPTLWEMLNRVAGGPGLAFETWVSAYPEPLRSRRHCPSTFALPTSQTRDVGHP
jgi:SAM-dependent methyltransferase